MIERSFIPEYSSKERAKLQTFKFKSNTEDIIVHL